MPWRNSKDLRRSPTVDTLLVYTAERGSSRPDWLPIHRLDLPRRSFGGRIFRPQARCPQGCAISDFGALFSGVPAWASILPGAMFRRKTLSIANA